MSIFRSAEVGSQVTKAEIDVLRLQLRHVATRGVPKAPIERLPSETLSEIFKYLCNVVSIPLTKEDFQWVLARVCSRWRLISRTDPRLWKIQVDLDMNWRHLKRALDLFPSTVLLDVSLKTDDDITPLKLLPPYLRRCKSLSFVKSIKLFDELWSGVQKDSFANLQRLSLEVISHSANIQTPESESPWESAGQALQMASRLETVDLTSSDASTSEILASLSLPWGQIKDMSLELALDFVDIYGFLNKCQSLTRLSMNSGDVDITYLPLNDALCLPCLHTLSLRNYGSVPFISAFFNWETLVNLDLTDLNVTRHDFHNALQNCTNLKRLSLETVHFDKRFPQQSLCIPRLQCLYIDYPWKHPGLKLTNFVCPMLSYVRISYDHKRNDNLSDPMGLPRGPIATLHYSADIPASWIHAILTHISATAKSVSFPHSHLEHTLLRDIGSGGLLPSLQYLECRILKSETVDAIIEMLDIYVSRAVQPPGSSEGLKHLALLNVWVSEAQTERLNRFRTEHGIRITSATPLEIMTIF